jgi:hypothetical protein
VTCGLPDLASPECDCHEWHDVDEIGEWPHSLAGGRASHPKSVRDIVATEPIWNRSELSHQELTARIIAAGRRIDHAHALSAMTFEDGRISLDNGVHRWAVAVELGIKRVPVEMTWVSPEPTWQWGWDLVSPARRGAAFVRAGPARRNRALFGCAGIMSRHERDRHPGLRKTWTTCRSSGNG